MAQQMKQIIIFAAIAIILMTMAGGNTQASTKSLQEVKQYNEPTLFNIEGVTDVYTDVKTNEIVIGIERPDVIGKIPKSIDGYHVRYVMTGRINALSGSDTTYSRTDVNRPVFGGISVGDSQITAGTLGIVTNEGYVLSAAHILAMDGAGNFLPYRAAIYQPGPADGGMIGNTIGHLASYLYIIFNNNNANNKADAAISDLIVPGNIGTELNATNDGFYTINGTTGITNGDIVRKSGRTTGVTTDTVIDTNASVKVCYFGNFLYCSKWAVFNDQIIVDNSGGSFAQPGDSGSAVDENGKFVGLVFAGSNTLTVVEKQENILGMLGVTI